MRGYCKCDLCGGVYHKKDNKFYDGITVWKYNWTDSRSLPDDDEKLITPDGESTDIPATMDVCPNCFQLFYSWIGIQRRGIEKSLVNNDNFPMNPPE